MFMSMPRSASAASPSHSRTRHKEESRLSQSSETMPFDDMLTVSATKQQQQSTTRESAVVSPKQKEPIHRHRALATCLADHHEYVSFAEWVETDNPSIEMSRSSVYSNTMTFASGLGDEPLSSPELHYTVYKQDLPSLKQEPWGLPLVNFSDEFVAEYRGENDKQDPNEQSIHIDDDFRNDKTWVHALQEGRRWVSGFPGPKLDTSRQSEMQLHFTLPKVTNPDELVTMLRSGVDMFHPLTSLLECLPRGTLGIVPLRIWIVNEQGALPVDCNVQLYSYTHMPHRSKEDAYQLTPWFSTQGPNPSLKPADDLRLLSHMVRAHTPLSIHPFRVFTCDKKVTQPEFIRWAMTDFSAVRSLLNSKECAHINEQTKRHIKDLPVDAIHAKNVLQFLCLDEWHRLVEAAQQRQDIGVTPCDIKLSTKSGTFVVDYGVMNELITEKENEVNADINVMYFTSGDKGLMLKLRSIHSNDETFSRYSSSRVTPPPSFSYQCTVHIQFVPLA